MGGGGSGSVDFPDHYKSWLYNGLFGFSDMSITDTFSYSITDAVNDQYTNSPYASATAYDPDTEIGAAASALADFSTLVAALNYSSDFTAAIAIALANIPANTPSADTTSLDTPSLDTATLDSISIDETRTDADIDNFDALLTAEITDVDLPKFQAGMLNIGAVNTSAYAMGQALLLAYKNREVAKYGTGLRIELEKMYDELNTRFKLQRREIDRDHQVRYRTSISQQTTTYRQIEADLKKDYRQRITAEQTEFRRYVFAATVHMLGDLMRAATLSGDVAKMTLEEKRAHMIAKKEEISEQLQFDEHDARWYIDSFQYAANFLAASQGGVGMQGQKRPSAAVSALAGGLSGAGAGAAIGASMGSGGGPYGAAIGAVVGGVGGYLGAM